MTKAFVRVAIALPAIALVAATPGQARDPQLTVIAPAKHTARVAYRDLDLRDSQGIAVLKARVDEASLEVCEATSFPVLMDMVGRSNCIQNARIEARPQVAAAIERARSGQTVALNAAIQVSAAF